MQIRPARRVVPLAALSILLVSTLLAAEPTPDGRWTGTVHGGGFTLEVSLEIAHSGDGAWSGSIDLPQQGARGLKLADFAVAGRSVRFRIDGVPGEPTFDGTLSDDGARLEGAFRQGGQDFEFTLLRPEPTAPELVESIDAWIAKSLETWRVPGAGVAVVRDGQVALAKGYGKRDVEAGLPATERTLFAIGSSTKAFTATLIAMLVDEGTLAWDEPVRTWLPEFALHDEVATAHATPRDLLSHRTGLPRHDLAWYGSDRSREELYAGLVSLVPNRGFRERFQYQNLMFMTAGLLAGRVSGSSWEELVRARILDPLGMQRTVLSIDALERDPDHAAGYGDKPGADPPARERLPYRRIEAVGPAGSIHASAEEMARWLLFNLDGGRIEGRQILGEAALRELRTPQVAVPPEGVIAQLMIHPEMPIQTYGLGWFVTVYRGHELVHHGGNIDGFAAQVAFLPRDGVGVAVLTNASNAFGALASLLGALDRALELEPIDWNARFAPLEAAMRAQAEQAKQTKPERQPDAPPGHPLEDYAGDYAEPGYGRVSVRLRDGKLRLAFAGADVALEPWHHEVFRIAEGTGQGMMIRFGGNARGDVVELAAPFEPTAPDILFLREPPPERRGRAWLLSLAGDYDLSGTPCVVRLRADDTLTVSVAGQPTYALASYDGLAFDLEGLTGYSVRFELTAGRVAGLAFVQPNGVFRARRVEAAAR